MMISMCVQVDLFSGAPMVEPFEALSESEFKEMAQRADIVDAVACCDPCVKCRYSGLCDSDDCAMHGFRLDSRKPLKGTYYDWCH